MNADSEFEPLRAKMNDLGISLSCMYKKENVPDTEKFNQTVKERV